MSGTIRTVIKIHGEVVSDRFVIYSDDTIEEAHELLDLGLTQLEIIHTFDPPLMPVPSEVDDA